jgi:hypothetical protein
VTLAYDLALEKVVKTVVDQDGSVSQILVSGEKITTYAICGAARPGRINAICTEPANHLSRWHRGNVRHVISKNRLEQWRLNGHPPPPWYHAMSKYRWRVEYQQLSLFPQNLVANETWSYRIRRELTPEERRRTYNWGYVEHTPGRIAEVPEYPLYRDNVLIPPLWDEKEGEDTPRSTLLINIH